MQFNTDLLQTLTLNTKAAASGVNAEAENAIGANASGEFLSLLTEAKELAKSGAITPSEFMASLGDDSLSLNPNEKKALAKSFMDFMPKEGLAAEGSSLEELPKAEKSDLQNILGTKVAAKNVKVSTTQMPTDMSMAKVDASNMQLGEAEIDPKIANGKLLSLNAAKMAKQTKAPVQTAQDFVMQNQALGKTVGSEQGNAARKSFFPKSKSQINAFNKEQNVINKSVFAGKNPFTTSETNPLNTSNITNGESALFQAVEGVDQNIQATMMDSSALKAATGATTLTSNVATNVMDLSSINIQNTEQIIDKISEYITTSRLENQDSVELLVKHDSLGQFKVKASTGDLPSQVNLDIAAASEKAKVFFQENEVEMIKTLSKSGVKLGDVKVALTGDSSSQSFDKNDSNNQNNNGLNSKSNQQFASGRDESGRERREELWNMYRERLGA